MGLHKRHTHGRVFHGDAARELLREHKRDSHSDRLRWHVPEGFEPQEKQVVDSSDEDTEQAYSVVYVTLSQTFDGPAVYSTLTNDPETPKTAAKATPTRSVNDDEAAYDAAKSSAQAGNKASATSVATVSPAETNQAYTTFATQTHGANVVGGTPVQATRSATATATPEESNAGMTGGAKAGLAIGSILAIGLALGLVFFCWRRKNTQKSQEELNEKHGSFADVSARGVEAGGFNGAAAVAAGAKRSSTQTEKVPSSLRSTRTSSTAPRLSLRPVTQFLPNLADNRKSTGNGANQSAWERTPANGDKNPFDDATMLSEKQAQPNNPPSNPFDEQRKSNDSQQVAAAGGVAAAATGAAIAKGRNHSSKSSWEVGEPATPRNAHLASAAAVPVAAPTPRDAPPRGPNNVHRVQLDFKPSMDDELELRSGQLVRMLHEYDDGWALCIRMDRSQQGVAPRTCLSKVPVKPRPQGPPPQQGPRPGTSQGPRRPSNPPAPNGPPNGGMIPRPLTPTQQQPPLRTPSPAEKPVKPSEASTSPVGVPARKPVPGQAM